MSRVPGVGGKFLKADDIKDGDKVKILTEADWEETKWIKDDGTKQMQYSCTVEYKGEERRLKLNMESCRNLTVYGEDSKDWVGKEVVLSRIKVMVGGQTKYSIIAEAVAGAGTQTTDGMVCTCLPEDMDVDPDGICRNCGKSRVE